MKRENLTDLASQVIGPETLAKIRGFSAERDKLLIEINRKRNGQGQPIKEIPRKLMIELMRKYNLIGILSAKEEGDKK